MKNVFVYIKKQIKSFWKKNFTLKKEIALRLNGFYFYKMREIENFKTERSRKEMLLKEIYIFR